MARPLINDPSLTHFNLDIETLSISPRAYIASMACFVFDPWGKEMPKKNSIYRACVGLKDETQDDRKKDFDTVFWWLTQKPIAITYALHEVNCKDLASMLQGLESYIIEHSNGTDEVVIWVRGLSFDLAILRDVYIELGIEQPWHFWNEMDGRVLENLAQVQGIPKWIKPEDLHTVAHDPVGDVLNQISQVQYYLAPKLHVSDKSTGAKILMGAVLESEPTLAGQSTLDVVKSRMNVPQETSGILNEEYKMDDDDAWRQQATRPTPSGIVRTNLEMRLTDARTNAGKKAARVVYFLWRLCGKPNGKNTYTRKLEQEYIDQAREELKWETSPGLGNGTVGIKPENIPEKHPENEGIGQIGLSIMESGKDDDAPI